MGRGWLHIVKSIGESWECLYDLSRSPVTETVRQPQQEPPTSLDGIPRPETQPGGVDQVEVAENTPLRPQDFHLVHTCGPETEPDVHMLMAQDL